NYGVDDIEHGHTVMDYRGLSHRSRPNVNLFGYPALQHGGMLRVDPERGLSAVEGSSEPSHMLSPSGKSKER
ncbi:MAG TPA: hypothetical protein VGA86_09190, partial [Desulfatiglandales bacterium]